MTITIPLPVRQKLNKSRRANEALNNAIEAVEDCKPLAAEDVHQLLLLLGVKGYTSA